MRPGPASPSRSTSLGRAGGVALLLVVCVGPTACRDQGRQAPFDECADLACREAAIEAEWRVDPSAASAKVAAIDGELEQLALVSHLAETYPGQTDGLCVLLAPGPSRERCERLNQRPHLFKRTFKVGRTALRERRAGGPTSAVLPVVALPRAWSETDLADPCTAAADRGGCLAVAAAGAATASEPGRAAALCQLSAIEALAQDCTFQAAEALAAAEGHHGYAAAASLCDAAGQFASMCHSHVLSAINRTAIAPAGMNLDDARDAIEGAAAVAGTWQPVDPRVAELYVDRYWSVYFAAAYSRSTETVGDPLELFPAEAHPHIRASLALLLHDQGRLAGPLDSRVATLSDALSSRSSGRVLPSRPTMLVAVKNHWRRDDDEGRSVRAVYFQGPARRPLGADRDQDLALCVLEAAAQAEPPDEGLLIQASSDPDPVVGWSARRLLTALDGESDRPTER